MDAAGQPQRLSMRTKVMLPVLGILVLLPSLMLWIVDRNNTQQAQSEARRSLATAEAFFRNALEQQAAAARVRWRGVVNEPKVRAVTQLLAVESAAAATTLTRFLREEYAAGNDFTLFADRQGGVLAGVRRDSAGPALDAFAQAALGITHAALEGEVASGSVRLAGRVYDVVAVPLVSADGGEVAGALTVGLEFGDAAVRELQRLTGSEIVLFAAGQVLASTLGGSGQPQLTGLLRGTAPGDGGPADVVPVEVAGEHFHALGGSFDWRGGERGFRYFLLSSYEQRLRALRDTRTTVVGLSLAGIILSAALVWVLVGRITRPLRELRDTAEAVGRGDFTRRLERFSNDECGDLAETFNSMTVNLRESRAELEKAVETLRNTQHQLIQSEKLSAVGQFVSGVAHELNNPLTAVIGFADLLSQTAHDEKIRPHLDLIAKSAQRCHRIVHSLLSFARQHKAERVPVILNETIDEVIELLAYDFRTSNIEIVRAFSPDLPPINADPHQLQQVFVNLLSNARQALQSFRTDGRVTIRTGVQAGKVRLEFADNGPGISPENVSKVFDPFFTTKPVGKGTGLGLSLSYGIIQEHGGAISVQSTLGQGATFVIELPIPDAPAAVFVPDGRGSSRAPYQPVGSGKSVLIVDDEEWIRILIGELLAREGYEAEFAAGGEQAIEILRQRRFDLILCDWKMPGLNGMRLYEHLLVNDPAAAKRVHFMTGDVVNEAFEEFLKRHDKGFLPKPFSIGEFRAAVAHAAKDGK